MCVTKPIHVHADKWSGNIATFPVNNSTPAIRIDASASQLLFFGTHASARARTHTHTHTHTNLEFLRVNVAA